MEGFQPPFLLAIEPGILPLPSFRYEKGGKRHVKRGYVFFWKGLFWGYGELPGDQERGEIFTALGFRNGNAQNWFGEHPVVAVCDPRGKFRELELLPGKIDLDVAIDVIRLVGLLVAFCLEPGMPDLAILLLQPLEKVLKRD